MAKMEAFLTNLNSLRPLAESKAKTTTEDWLEEHITPTTPALDNTLSVAGAAAESKATGDAITAAVSSLNNQIKEIDTKQIEDDVELGTYKKTFTTVSQTSYTYFPLYLPEGTYYATANSTGSVIQLRDSSQTAIITIPKTANNYEFTITAAQSAAIVDMSVYQGGVTFEVKTGKLYDIDENKAEIQTFKNEVMDYDVQYLTDGIRDIGKYYIYNSTTGVISKGSAETLSAFEFDISPGTYYYYKLYADSFIKDLTTGTVSQLQNASSHQSVTLEHDSRAYISVPNGNYNVSAYFSNFNIWLTPTMPQGDFNQLLSNVLMESVENGEVHQYSFSSNGYAPYTRNILRGDAFTISFDQCSSSSVKIQVEGVLANDSTENILPNIGVGEKRFFVANNNYKALNIVISLPASTGRYTITAHTKIGKLLTDENIFYCGSSRELTTLKAGIEKATQYMDSILYVDAGIYDLITEFGSEWFEALTSASTLSGLVLKNRIHIIFAPNSKVISNYTGDNEYAQELYSPFNAGEYGFTLENLTLECSWCRYGIHDERNGAEEQYKSHYINCNVYVDNSENDYWPANSCIGGGLGSNAEVIIENCVWGTGDANTRDGVYFHQSNKTSSTDYRSFVCVKDSYFKTGCIQFDDDRAGSTSGKTIYQATGNSFLKKYPNTNDQGVYVANMTSPTSEVQAWNNVIRTT